MERNLRESEELKYSKLSNVVMLGHNRMFNFPEQLFRLDWIGKLRRIDLSFNHITVIPDQLILCSGLKELWLQSNPIKRFPPKMALLTKLEVVDVRNTKLEEIPAEMATLPKLFEIDWREAPVAEEYQRRYNIPVNDIVKLKDVLSNLHHRVGLEVKLSNSLSDEHYMKEADTPNFKPTIQRIVEECSLLFPELEDFRIFVKRAGNLLPEFTRQVTPAALEKVKDEFYGLQRETLRKRLSADVEIKLRAVYFDRIERQSVEQVIASIYNSVESLEDIQFLIKYASQVLPPTPQEATGEVVWGNMLALQTELTNKRNAAIDGLAAVMLQLYPEQEPSLLKQKAIAVAAVFQQDRFASKRELTNLSRVTAESAKVFPPDFASVVPADVYSKTVALFARKS